MSGDTDFLLLYEELGLAPGRCSLDEFKRAYRRRISSLHPDRRPDRIDDDAPEVMRRLTTLYGAAIAFERRFGRLPGAEPAGARRSSVVTPQSGHGNVSMPAFRREPLLPLPEPKSMRKRVLLALLILLALAWALWGAGTIAQ
ncbi:MAG TPA: hypothetical protein VLL04_13220 [Rhizomicrobium sp.]|nr:hypothetical protein [Rhizomicrobium sp.]